MMQSPVEIGSMLAGKYRIERVIGQGGMGIVVAAMHDELDQRVAIKFLSPEGAKGTEWISRFAREAKTAAKIKNEHAVKVYDVGRLESGIPFMVMEYLEGRNLDELLEEHRMLPIEEAAEYILQACEALAEAHLVGIVHRDLKPANLFLTYRGDGTACVKILDFGISKVDENLAIGASVTHTTSLVGSPLYMSPERLKGAKDVDRRADIWSLGVLLQEMVTGTTPFVAETIPEIHAMVLTQAPTPLHRALPSAPAELDALVLKCLEKSPDARFQNVLEFATALGAIAPASQPTVERIARIAMGTSGARARVSMVPSGAGSGPYTPVTSLTPNPRLAVTAAAEEMATDVRDSGRISAPRFVPPSRESLPTVSATGTLGDALKKSGGKFAVIGAAAMMVVVLATLVAIRRHGSSETSSYGAMKTATATAIVPPEKPAAQATTTETATAPANVEASQTIEAHADEPVDPKAHAAAHVAPKHRAPKATASGSATPTASATAPVAAPTETGLVIDYGGRN